MKTILATFGIMALAVSLSCATLVEYSWEDGGTILGSYGNLVNPTNVATGSDPGINNVDTPTYDPALTLTPRTGSGMLEVMEDPHASTPQAFIAYIENLAEGDLVTASFYGWDSTPSASPSMRIWGHYADNGDVTSYTGSAGGNSTYTDGVLNGNWSQVEYTWTVGAGYEALVIEARLYSTPSTGAQNSTYWIDDLSVTAPDSSTITVVPEPTTFTLFGLIGLAVYVCRKVMGKKNRNLGRH